MDDEQKEHQTNDNLFEHGATPISPEQDPRMSKEEILNHGLTISISSALVFVVHNAGNYKKAGPKDMMRGSRK